MFEGLAILPSITLEGGGRFDDGIFFSSPACLSLATREEDLTPGFAGILLLAYLGKIKSFDANVLPGFGEFLGIEEAFSPYPTGIAEILAVRGGISTRAEVDDEDGILVTTSELMLAEDKFPLLRLSSQ